MLTELVPVLGNSTMLATAFVSLRTFIFWGHSNGEYPKTIHLYIMYTNNEVCYALPLAGCNQFLGSPFTPLKNKLHMSKFVTQTVTLDVNLRDMA